MPPLTAGAASRPTETRSPAARPRATEASASPSRPGPSTTSPPLTEKQLIRAINDAILSNYLREADLEGTPLEGLVTGKSRSPLEDDFRPWLRRFHLPEPQYNVHVNGREVDVYYPEARLIVELDGFATHKTRFAFEGDRERDAHNLVNGLSTIRITRDRLTRAPAKEAERLTAILTARRITLTDF